MRTEALTLWQSRCCCQMKTFCVSLRSAGTKRGGTRPECSLTLLSAALSHGALGNKWSRQRQPAKEVNSGFEIEMK